MDLTSKLEERPVARQLRYSLLQYMSGSSFNPTNAITIEDLKKLKADKKQSDFSTTDIYAD